MRIFQEYSLKFLSNSMQTSLLAILEAWTHQTQHIEPGLMILQRLKAAKCVFPRKQVFLLILQTGFLISFELNIEFFQIFVLLITSPQLNGF